jgi:hypothetical protein
MANVMSGQLRLARNVNVEPERRCDHHVLLFQHADQLLIFSTRIYLLVVQCSIHQIPRMTVGDIGGQDQRLSGPFMASKGAMAT